MAAISLLLAEDNLQHQSLLVTALTEGRPHVQVTLATTGSQVLDLLHKRKFDCVVMDYHLSDIQADQLLQDARIVLESCPALIISSSRKQEVVVNSIRHGCVDFLPKEAALQPEHLWNRVAAAMNGFALRRRENRSSERRMKMLSHQAHTDVLTGLQNRRHLEEGLKDGRWKNDRRKTLVCAMLDVDHFKCVNDAFGHAAGDAVLRNVARVIRLHAGPGAVTVRWGGEEFLIIRHVPTLTTAWLWADELRTQVSQARVQNRRSSISITATIGLVTAPSFSISEATIEQADGALRLGKGLGRNMVCTALMNEAEQAVNELRLPLASGLNARAGRLKVLAHLQPQLGPMQQEYLTNHSQTVAELAGSLATNLGLDEESVHSISMAGLFHDIGKCVIPEELLAKPAHLTQGESDFVNRSGRHGAHLAGLLGLDQRTVDLVDRPWKQRQRTGARPRGGQDLPSDAAGPDELGVNVIRVADAVASMKTTRPWAAQRTPEQIIHELKLNRDGAFDPTVVEALDEVLQLAA